MLFFTIRTSALLLAGLLCGSAAAAQNWEWVATSAAGEATGHRLATDAAGNSYVAGTFKGAVTFGAHTLTSAGATDVFVGKLSPAGQWLWAARAGGEQADVVSTITTTPTGVAIGGSYGRGAAFGATVLGTDSAQSTGAYVAQLDAAGQWQWATSSQYPDEVGITGLAADSAGNLYTAGYMNDPNGGSNTFGFGGRSLPLDTLQHGAFVAGLDAAGRCRWLRGLVNDAGYQRINALVAEPNGTVYIGGNWGAQGLGICGSSPGGGSSTTGIVFLDAGHGFVWALDGATGTRRWDVTDSTPTGAGSSVEMLALGAGGLAIGGGFTGRMTLSGPGQVLTDTIAPQYYRCFFGRLTTAGSGLWLNHVESTYGSVAINALAQGPAGEVYVGGTLGDSARVTMGSSPAMISFDFTTALNTRQKRTDAFLALLDGATGRWQWASLLQGPGRDQLAGLTMDAAGHLLATGSTAGDVAFGATLLPATPQPGAFVARLDAAAPLVLAFAPLRGRPGTPVTLVGHHLSDATQLLFNGTPAAFTVVNADTILTTVPVGATTGHIWLHTPATAARGPVPFTVFGAPLGLAEAGEAAFAVFPNPARAQAMVQLADGPTALELVNTLGQVVRRLPPGPTEVTLPLAGLPAGVYSLRAGTRVTRLVVE